MGAAASSSAIPMTLNRRLLLSAGLAAPWATVLAQGDTGNVRALLREGGLTLAFRHALAPGTFDPPGFRVDDCGTQRNLSDEGRAQAHRIGAWFQAAQLAPAAVRSSPWCRCVDTATLAFGRADRWTALGSPRGFAEQTNADHLRQLRTALRQASAQRGRFEVWVTHMFVLSALAQENTASGEALLLRAGPGEAVQVLGRLAIA